MKFNIDNNDFNHLNYLKVNFNDFDSAVTEGYAMQHVLQLYSQNNEFDIDRRILAAKLAIWIGINDITVEMIHKNELWMRQFILNCFRQCPLDKNDYSYLRVYYSNAIASLELTCQEE